VARLARITALALFIVTGPGLAAHVAAQATCVDSTGDMCLTNLRSRRGPDAVIDDIFQTSDGRYAPQLTYGTYVRGVNGCIGGTGFTDCGLGAPFSRCRTILTGYACCTPGTPGCAPPGGLNPAVQANSLDWLWTQVLRTNDSGAVVDDGAPGFYYPWRGRIYDLGGEANRVVVFPISDHGPLPCEAFEYAVWLSNDPNATAIAPEGAPDPNLWNPARLVRVFQQGWTRNVTAEGAVDRERGDLASFLRDASAGDAVADSLVTVWALPCGLSFRYVSIQAGNDGNPGPECQFHSSDDELDAVAGLNEDDTAICIDADGDGHRDAACGGTDCDDTNPARHPGAFERCDATEDVDCLPAASCPEGTTCDDESGLCTTQCFEGGCAAGYTCVGDRCVEEACATRTEPCPSGSLCRGGECVGPCDGVVCPLGERCVGGACVDPCEGVVCPTNQVCIARDPSARTLCGPSCVCSDLAAPLCPAGRACDTRDGSPARGQCVDPGCETASCGPGESCSGGACVDGCTGVVCPRAQVCVDGSCVVDLCASVVCPGGQRCRAGACFDPCDETACGEGRICRDGACVPDPCFGVECPDGRCVSGTCVPNGAVDAGRLDAGRRDAGRGPIVSQPGCGCRAAGAPTPYGVLVFGLVLVALVLRRRR
jgi:hypothetical protein